jgi:hypothetical protein
MKNKILTLIFFSLGVLCFYIFVCQIEYDNYFITSLWLHISQFFFFGAIYYFHLTFKENKNHDKEK